MVFFLARGLLSRHIPEFSKLKVYAGEEPGGGLKLEDARRSMTMRWRQSSWHRSKVRPRRDFLASLRRNCLFC